MTADPADVLLSLYLRHYKENNTATEFSTIDTYLHMKSEILLYVISHHKTENYFEIINK